MPLIHLPLLETSAAGATAAVSRRQRSAPTVLLQHPRRDGTVGWLAFRNPIAVYAAERLEDVLPQLACVEAAVEGGLHAAGFLSYEAAPAFEPAIRVWERRTSDPPLAWWALFESPEEVGSGIDPAPELAPVGPGDWRPLITRERFRRALERIRELIAQGETYQVNYTFPLEAPFQGDALAWFITLAQAQRARHCAFVDTGRFAVCSASPELFLARDGERIVSRPMKGTARRGRYPAEDAARRAALDASPKNRAENVMIVDMVRNDLGRVAHPGSVEVEELCRLETYPTVHQLTSTVSARTTASLTEVLRALFPCASITGAPKIRTTAIIRELEVAPRGLYTGTIGHLAPGRRVQLNVAIRTATVDRETGVARYGTGGGIVWDSETSAEYDECRAKALVLRAPPRSFALLETLLWRPRRGYFLLDRHLERLLASAEYFGFPATVEAVLERLGSAVPGFGNVRTRVRLELEADGDLALASEPWPQRRHPRWRIVLDDRPIDSSDVFFFHKTTRRGAYEEACRRFPGHDEVILWNERGELTEGTRTTLVARVGGEWLTPPLECGLLAGTYRAELLARGRLREQVLPVRIFDTAEEILLINSLRGWIRTLRDST